MRLRTFLGCSLLLLGLTACNSGTSTDTKTDDKTDKNGKNDPAKASVEIVDVRPGGKLFKIETRSTGDFGAKVLLVCAFGAGDHKATLPDPKDVRGGDFWTGILVEDGGFGRGHRIITGGVPPTISPPFPDSVKAQRYRGSVRVLAQIYVEDKGNWEPKTPVFEKTIELK